jgi:hypothetical protein
MGKELKRGLAFDGSEKLKPRSDKSTNLLDRSIHMMTCPRIHSKTSGLQLNRLPRGEALHERFHIPITLSVSGLSVLQ